jgi:hypothetical protein
LLGQRLSEADVADLLNLMDHGFDPQLQQTAAQRLAAMNPTYSEVKDDLAGIWRLAGSENEFVANTARWHVTKAFQRAPISQCLL